VARAATKSGDTYSVALGLTLPLRVYRGFGIPGAGQANSRPFLCSPASVPSDCPSGESAFVPLNQVDDMSLLEGNAEGPDQVARLENEPGPDNPPEGWYLRAIRTTVKPDGTPATKADGTPRVTGGKLTITAQMGALSAVATAKITRPSTLGCCGQPGCTKMCRTFYAADRVDFEDIDLVDLVIREADANGMPPQYLMAQAVREAGPDPGDPRYANSYAFRYEATSRDFKQLSGDWDTAPREPGTVEDGVRRLLDRTFAYFRLGQTRSDATIQYLPCVTAGGAACIASEPLPVWEPSSVVPTSTQNVFGMLGVGSDQIRIRLAVNVFTPPGTPEFLQNFIADCAAGAPIAENEYCVAADAGTIRFGSPPATPISAQFKRLGDVTTTATGFGELIANDLDASIKLVCDNNDVKSSVPCDAGKSALSKNTTIRQWAKARAPFNPIADTNSLTRYGLPFSGSSLFALIKNDPSFEVQTNWFASASYGIMQLVPDDLRDKISRLVPADQRQRLWDLYDPFGHNPVDRLFDPTKSVKFGALEDIFVTVAQERDDSSCAVKFTQCTWDRLWARRLCVFNIGSPNSERRENGCPYSDEILERAPGFAPK
jgi:hypothetical protein